MRRVNALHRSAEKASIGPAEFFESRTTITSAAGTPTSTP
jgi:hypothetical protein